MFTVPFLTSVHTGLVLELSKVRNHRLCSGRMSVIRVTSTSTAVESCDKWTRDRALFARPDHLQLFHEGLMSKC